MGEQIAPALLRVPEKHAAPILERHRITHFWEIGQERIFNPETGLGYTPIKNGMPEETTNLRLNGDHIILYDNSDYNVILGVVPMDDLTFSRERSQGRSYYPYQISIRIYKKNEHRGTTSFWQVRLDQNGNPIAGEIGVYSPTGSVNRVVHEVIIDGLLRLGKETPSLEILQEGEVVGSIGIIPPEKSRRG